MLPTPVYHDYYAVMEIHQSADSAAIRTAYRRLARAKHPDKEGGTDAEFKLVSLTALFPLVCDITNAVTWLGEAYDHLNDPDKRRKYDEIYRTIIRPAQAKDQRIAELDRQLRKLGDKQKIPEVLLHNAQANLIRLYAERDSLKGEKEHILEETAREEAWWPYLSSFVPGNSAEFVRKKQRRDRATANVIGKQRTKEQSIHHKLAEIKLCNMELHFIIIEEDRIKAEVQKIAEDLLEVLGRRRQREQAGWARQSPRAYSTQNRHHSENWDY